MKLRTRTNQPVEGDELENLKLSGDLEVAEDSKVKVFENIVDKDGHLRFIEGDINLNESFTLVTKLYGKWSLSGSHLMFVLAGKIDNGTTISAQTIAHIQVPQWIFDKIVPIASESGRIEATSVTCYDASVSTTQTFTISFAKSTDLTLYMGAITTTADRYFRFSFDLLIDNE